MRRQLWSEQRCRSVCLFCSSRDAFARRAPVSSAPSRSGQLSYRSLRAFTASQRTQAPEDAPRPSNSTWGSAWGGMQPAQTGQNNAAQSKDRNGFLGGLLPHEKAARSRALASGPAVPRKDLRSSHDATTTAAQETSARTSQAPTVLRGPSRSNAIQPREPGTSPGKQPGWATASSEHTKTGARQPFGRQDHGRSRTPKSLSGSNAIQGGSAHTASQGPHGGHPPRPPHRAHPPSRVHRGPERPEMEQVPAGQEWGQLTRRKTTAPRQGKPHAELSKGNLGLESLQTDTGRDTNTKPWSRPESSAVNAFGAGAVPPAPSPDALLWVDTEQRNRKQRSQRHRRLSDDDAMTSTDDPETTLDRRERASAPRSGHKAKSVARRNTRHQEEDDDYFDEEALERAEARRRQKEAKRARKEKEIEAQQNRPTPIFLPELISVANLGLALGVKSEIFLEQLAELGFEDISQESIMSGETAALIAQEYGFEPSVDTGDSVDLKPRPVPADPSELPPRPPIVTIMGHVDHGKTTMLDWLRKTSVAAQEHGGITQHIGAFSVKLSAGRQITFLDTPGHAAFLTMRQRGANVTDIVILVVAADDSVKPQTLEALKHAQSANVPIIVAINKIDKDEARVDQVKADLARHGIEIEDYGGDVQVVCVSGKTGQGMADLEENILTLSEILDMRAESDGLAEGWVLESSIKPVGKAATVLVKRGTLRKGDIIVAGTTWARVRTLRSEAGVELDEAPPGTPVEILGWRDPPAAGDQVLQAPDEGKAKDAAHYRQELRDREKSANDVALQERREKEKEAAAQQETAEGDESGAPDEASGTAVVNFTVKGDVMGSVEAVCAAVLEIGNNEVRPAVLRSAPGQITEFDIEHAATSNSAIINFNNPIPGNMKRKAEDSGVDILDYTVIYHLTDAVRAKLSEKLTPTVSTRVLGEAEVLQVFPINVKGREYKNIAGCRIRNGLVTRGALYRVMRNGEKIFDGKLDSLKHGKKDVAEMRKGAECGLSFDEWQDFKQGDQIQAYEEIKEKRSL